MRSIFAPPLYVVRSYPLREIIAADYHLSREQGSDKRFYIKQADNPLFRQIRLITGFSGKFNPYVVFIDSAGSPKTEEYIGRLVRDGIYIDGHHFVFGERSASMTRNGIFSVVDADIFPELNKRITMDIQFDKTVLSKYYAYRGLFFSSCHCLEGWKPKVIIVPDLMLPVPQQRIKYVYDKTVEYEKDGEVRQWTQKDIAEDVRDMEINAFDGCGIHHPDITRQVTELLHAKAPVTTILWRIPWTKG